MSDNLDWIIEEALDWWSPCSKARLVSDDDLRAVAEAARKKALRELRDAIQELAWEIDEDGKVITFDSPDLGGELFELFAHGGRFEVKGDE